MIDNKIDISLKDKELFTNWIDIIAMRNRITNSFKRLIISLYTYISFRWGKDYYLMYYFNKPLDKMLKADTTKNYITSDNWFLSNKL